MFPGESDEEIAEKVAAFFNEISQQYTPIPNPSRPRTGTKHYEEFEVAARLKTFRKPKSRVHGDIFPELVTKYCDLLAEPLCYIYNLVVDTLEWPDAWKMETVNIIPKNNAPANMGELRNLSCTPLFSKVLESFILSCLLYTSPSPRDS